MQNLQNLENEKDHIFINDSVLEKW